MKNILLYPVSTEKAIKMMEIENKIIFVVDMRSSKTEIINAFQEEFKIKPISVNTQVKRSKKFAFIKLKQETPAIDIATRLGLM